MFFRILQSVSPLSLFGANLQLNTSKQSFCFVSLFLFSFLFGCKSKLKHTKIKTSKHPNYFATIHHRSTSLLNLSTYKALQFYTPIHNHKTYNNHQGLCEPSLNLSLPLPQKSYPSTCLFCFLISTPLHLQDAIIFFKPHLTTHSCTQMCSMWTDLTTLTTICMIPAMYLGSCNRLLPSEALALLVVWAAICWCEPIKTQGL